MTVPRSFQVRHFTEGGEEGQLGFLGECGEGTGLCSVQQGTSLQCTPSVEWAGPPSVLWAIVVDFTGEKRLIVIEYEFEA